jgi:hypothetical protein
MKNAFLIHSTGGNPSETFFPWLEKELEKMGFEVTIPQFPTPLGQNVDNWMRVAKPYFKNFDEDTIVMGRSIGGPMVLRVLEQIDVKIKGAFIVAGFCSDIRNPLFTPLIGSFVKKPFVWEKIRKNCKNFFVYQSDNDPYIPVEKGEELAEKLKTKMTLVHNAEHFGLSAQYVKFPLLLKDVKSVY